MTINNYGNQPSVQVSIKKLNTAIPYSDVANIEAKTAPFDTKWFGQVASSFNLKESKTTHKSDSFDATYMSQNIKGGNIVCRGGMNMNLLVEGQEWIYEMILGGRFTNDSYSTVTSRGVHTLYPNPSGLVGGKTFLAERQITNMATSGYKVFCNCHVNSINISAPQTGPCKADIDMIAMFPSAFMDTKRQAVIPFMEDEYYIGHRGLLKLKPYDDIADTFGTEFTPDFVEGFDLSISANIIDSTYTYNADRDISIYLAEVPYGRRSITGNIACIFTANAQLEQAYKDLSAMVLNFELSQNDYKIQFIIPRAKFTEAIEPDLSSGDGLIKVSIPFESIPYDDSTNDYDLKVVITDSIETYPADFEDVTFI
jgi:hypothetical protein